MVDQKAGNNAVQFGEIGSVGEININTHHTPASIPFQAPSLPPNFVERPLPRQQVKALLLGQEALNRGTLVLSAIYGLGGIGKSILAAAIAHDPDVKACFTDGVLWATLGQKPDLLPLLSSWILALGDNNYKPIQPDDAKRHLQTLLYDKKVLLVVDDVWNPEHVEYFQVGGAGCRVLITTREAMILGANRYDLDVMTKSESLKLLESQPQPRQLTQAEQQQAELLAETVGYLPLALELAAAQIADGITWEELLEDLRAEIAHLDALDLFVDCSSEEKRKKYSLVASFNLSLNSLTPELLKQFAWFGVLPEDVAITHAMAATLWGVNPRQALTILRQLRSKALLQTGTIQFENKPTYKLHDLMHDVAVGLLTGEKVSLQPEKLPGLGLSLPAAHSALLNRYQEKTQSGQWHTLPGDGYIHAHLTWHFQQANQVHQIHQLLQEETPAGGNGWYEACDRLGQTANFVTDVGRAWELAEDSWTETTSSQVIGLQCRYALIIASLNSLAANLRVELLITLIQKNVWTPEQALVYVLQSSNPQQKANLLTNLANHLPPNLKELALSKALAAAR
ncbi:NB-ARC domain-containing protein, partial [Rivularia sp. UHCC 0363]|uniref:NB-ARC domain-containing protein n=1 Tax=Rivularia sp. UHCC 0363 TaxID=3110244 RepID=UPI002B20F349